MVEEINIKVGKIYRIGHVIEELKKHPDIRLGHIFVSNRHEYHIGLDELYVLQKKIKKTEREGSITEVYDISGKRRIDPYDITILSIIDPYTKYEKYEKFYDELYAQISGAVEQSSSGVIKALSDDILKEARKEQFVIEKDDDLFDGICIYFSRKGIESRRIAQSEEGERKEFVIFGREGTITKEENVEKEERVVKEEEKKKLFVTSEQEIKKLKEETKEFESFYEELKKDVVPFAEKSKDKEAAVNIDDIMKEARKKILGVDNKKEIFLQGLILYYKTQGIDTEVMKAKNFMIFKIL